MIREAPAELLGHLESHGLRAFRVLAATVVVAKTPPSAIRYLGAQPVHVVEVAVDCNNLRPVDGGTEHLVRLQVVGNEYVARQPETRRMRRHAVGQIPGGHAPKYGKAQLHVAGGGNRNDAVL